MKAVEFSHLSLRVRDLDRVRAYYEEVLGFRTLASSPEGASLAPEGLPRPLLILEAAPDATPRMRGEAGLFHVAFLYPSRAALGTMLRHLVNLGIAIGAGDHGVSEALYLEDPEGNGIELYADRPRVGWPVNADGSIEMGTEEVDLNSLLEAGSEDDFAEAAASARIGHIHLSVSDLGHAEKLYAGLLDFPVRQRSYPKALFLGRNGYHHHFGLNTWRSRAPKHKGALGLQRFSITLRDPADFVAIAARNAENGGTSTGLQPDGSLRIIDKDGWEIELHRG